MRGIVISHRTRTGVGLIGAMLTAAFLWSQSGDTWGRSGTSLVARKVVLTAGLPGYEQGASRLVLDNPPPGTPEPGLLTLPHIFEAVQEGDTLHWRKRALPLGGIEAFDFEARGDGRTVRWREGYPFLFLGLSLLSLGVGFVLWLILSLFSALLRLSNPPEA